MISAAVGVGVLVALQSRVNAELAAEVGSGVLAAVISFGTGLLLVWALIALRAELRAAVAGLPGDVRSGRLRWWHLLGGLGGAWLVTTQGMVVPAVGVTVFTVAVVAGQVGGSLYVDRAGLSPAGHLALTPNRVIAALVALVAVVVSGFQGTGQGVSWVVLLAVTAGVGIAVQQAINGRVAVVSRQSLAATGVNFLVGITGLLLAFGLAVLAGGATLGTWPGQWWLYIGGPLGVAFIALAAWAVRGVGVLVFGLLSIGGQLLGSVVLDLMLPTGGSSFGWPQVVAITLIALAALVATNPGARTLRGRRLTATHDG